MVKSGTKFKVIKSGLTGTVGRHSSFTIWGEYLFRVDFYNEDGSFYYSTDVFESTLVNNFAHNIYREEV